MLTWSNSLLEKNEFSNEISKKIFFYRTPLMPASIFCYFTACISHLSFILLEAANVESSTK